MSLCSSNLDTSLFEGCKNTDYDKNNIPNGTLCLADIFHGDCPFINSNAEINSFSYGFLSETNDVIYVFYCLDALRFFKGCIKHQLC